MSDEPGTVPLPPEETWVRGGAAPGFGVLMKKQNKIIQFVNWLVFPWEIIPLLSIVFLNMVIYSGTGLLTASWKRYDLTLEFDRMVPFLPGFVWFYVLAFPFWAANYLLAARRGKDIFYRYVVTDITVHIICFLFFLFLPTTNVRPEITGNSLGEWLLRFIYWVDGGDNPGNLFPSIHCYCSWLCFRGLVGAKEEEIPVKYQWFSLVMALLIIISTQTLKQHYIVDAIGGVVLVEAAWWFYRKPSRYAWIRRMYEKINNRFGLETRSKVFL